MTIFENVECFQYLKLEKYSLKNENLFHKIGVSFLVESTYIKSAIMPYKSALPKASFKVNRMRRAKLTYHKERDFVINYDFF